MGCMAACLLCCRPNESHAGRDLPVEAVLIVLGNEPLDDSTPTVDMIARVNKAVEYLEEHPTSILLFSGGPTAGTNTEARMMAGLAMSQ